MIEFTKAFKTSDGETFATIELAQRHELDLLIGDKVPDASVDEMINVLMANAEKVVDILTTKPNSRPKARKAHGGTKPRKATVDAAVNRALQDGKQ